MRPRAIGTTRTAGPGSRRRAGRGRLQRQAGRATGRAAATIPCGRSRYRLAVVQRGLLHPRIRPDTRRCGGPAGRGRVERRQDRSRAGTPREMRTSGRSARTANGCSRAAAAAWSTCGTRPPAQPAGAAAALRRLLQRGRLQPGRLAVPGRQPGRHRPGLGDRPAPAAISPVPHDCGRANVLHLSTATAADPMSGYSPDGRRGWNGPRTGRRVFARAGTPRRDRSRTPGRSSPPPSATTARAWSSPAAASSGRGMRARSRRPGRRSRRRRCAAGIRVDHNHLSRDGTRIVAWDDRRRSRSGT